MILENYNFETGIHRNKEVIWIKFPFDHTLKTELKISFPSAKWSQSHKSWYLPDLPAVIFALCIPQ